MYYRTYEPVYTQAGKEAIKSHETRLSYCREKLKLHIETTHWFCIPNDQPYNACSGSPWEGLHLIWFEKEKKWTRGKGQELSQIIRQYQILGSAVQINASKDRSVPDIMHIHVLSD